MLERFLDVLNSNGLIAAFAFIGLLMLACNLAARYLTGGRIHGSAIAIAAEWSPVVRGVQQSAANMARLAPTVANVSESDAST